MNEWLPVVVGFGLIALMLATRRFFPRTWLAGELRQWYGAKPHGPYLALTRRDYGRRFSYSALAAIALIGSAVALFPLTERLPNESRTRLTLEVYFFLAFILGAVAGLAAALSLFAAAFWRPKRVKLSERGTLDLANYLGLLSDGELEHSAWRDFSAVRFEDERIEAMRRVLVSRIGSTPRELTDSEIAWLRESVDQLLEPTALPID